MYIVNNWDDAKHITMHRIIEINKILDQRGNLSFLQSNKEVPFDIKRVYWIYDVPGGEMRGGHAYKNLDEVIIALSGSYDVVLHDGEKEYRYHLNRSYYGLYVPKMIWRHIENFSTNSLALILTNDVYKENEYIRDFSAFKTMKGL
jgi:oxalate decarboxylase/phosphoglucose isomerase-like protein (cupin superfamily)